jgi:hypothetical protein
LSLERGENSFSYPIAHFEVANLSHTDLEKIFLKGVKLHYEVCQERGYQSRVSIPFLCTLIVKYSFVKNLLFF